MESTDKEICRKGQQNIETEEVINKRKTIENLLFTKYLFNKTIKYIFLQRFETIISFGASVFFGQIILGEADKKERNLLSIIMEFNSKTKPNAGVPKEQKKYLLKHEYTS